MEERGQRARGEGEDNEKEKEKEKEKENEVNENLLFAVDLQHGASVAKR